jgi:hypothetical protein
MPPSAGGRSAVNTAPHAEADVIDGALEVAQGLPGDLAAREFAPKVFQRDLDLVQAARNRLLGHLVPSPCGLHLAVS